MVSDHTTDKPAVVVRSPPSQCAAGHQTLVNREAGRSSSPLCTQDPHLLKPVPPPLDNKPAPSSAKSSSSLDDVHDSDDEESVSVTTGRLSLSLSASSINVKSEVIQTEQVVSVDHGQEGEAVDETKKEEDDAEGHKKNDQSEMPAVVGGGRPPGKCSCGGGGGSGD